MSGANILCEYCDLPMGLFKRKRMCPGCSRWFCTTCLPRDYQFQLHRLCPAQASNIRLGRNPLGPTPICQRCSILAIDNVTKEHLMELRVKDLRQYLESKRIPTAGCREKSELVELVLEHCCSDAFLRQRAENQRRLRELTRRKEAEEEWEERRGRNQNDDISPESIDSGRDRRFNDAHVVTSSTETSSADDPDDVSIGEEIEVDPPSTTGRHPDEALGATARTTTTTSDDVGNWQRPVYEIVDDFRVPNGGAPVSSSSSFSGAPSANPPSNSTTTTTTAPVPPPSYDQVMASSSTSVDAADAVVEENSTQPADAEIFDVVDDDALPAEETTLISGANATSPSTTTTGGTTTTTGIIGGGADEGNGASSLHPPPPHHVSENGATTESLSSSSSPSRFAGRRRIRLDEMERIEDIKEMTPRQLKEILTANFVAYKGCCERFELEDRVKRLWNEHRVNQEVLRQTYEKDNNAAATGNGATSGNETSSGDGASSATTSGATTSSSSHNPDVDSQLCKICWDAVIDCVLLECGHMVTCTHCGRRMAECPICRQYVVRAVHVFRA